MFRLLSFATFKEYQYLKKRMQFCYAALCHVNGKIYKDSRTLNSLCTELLEIMLKL